MSYDIYLETSYDQDYLAAITGEECDVPDYSWNYTSNMASAWRHADADLAEFHNKQAKECIPVLDAAIYTMTQNVEEYRRFDNSNGWGGMDTLLPALRELLELLKRAPEAWVGVWR